MVYRTSYNSPVGRIGLESDGASLTGLWFERQKADLSEEPEYRELPVLAQTAHWLDQYFSGQVPDITMPLRFAGTAFQLEVWSILQTIPYGQTTTYGKIAAVIAAKRGIVKMSAQAVGNAVGKNPIAIIVPCHRVIGADGSLTGFAAGLDIKRALLNIEHRA